MIEEHNRCFWHLYIFIASEGKYLSRI